MPLKLSNAETEIGPVVPVLPAFTSGNALGSLNAKSGFVVTTRLNEAVSGDVTPFVVASSVTGYVPAVAVEGTATVAVMLTGEPAVGFTIVPGVRLQGAEVIVVLHETVTF